MKTLTYLTKKAFGKISHKEKQLNDFFKLPKANFDNFHEEKKDKSALKKALHDEEEVSCPWEVKDLVSRAMAGNKLKEMFESSTQSENLRMSKRIVEKMQVGDSFEVNEDFKRREVDNEYANYDRYFESYRQFKPTESSFEGLEEENERLTDKLNLVFERANAQHLASQAQEIHKAQEKMLLKKVEDNEGKIDFLQYLRYKEMHSEVEENEKKEAIALAKRYSSKDILSRAVHNVKEGSLKEEALSGISELREEDKVSPRPDFDEDIRTISKNPNKREILGKLSPLAKQEIYDLYKEGWKINKLAYKYGILPARVRAVVYQRELFWERVFPKIGMAGAKRLMEMEMAYGNHHKFVDYGFDLDIMGFMSRGMFFKTLLRAEIDYGKPPPEEYEAKGERKAEIEKTFRKTKPRKFDVIPERFIGQGQSGHMVYRIKAHKGKGAMRVSEMFKDIVRKGRTDPEKLPYNVREKIDLGPRIASAGYANRNKRRFVT